MNNEQLAQSLSGNVKYSLLDATKTLVLCGTLLASPAHVSTAPALRYSSAALKNGSDSLTVAKLYHHDAPTWSAVKVTPAMKAESVEAVTTTALKLINQLSFIDHDAKAEKQADAFFATKPVKTKKIVIRKHNVS